MVLTRTDTSEGFVNELRAFEGLIRPLTDAEWNAPSRCAGWSVGDVAAHLTGTLADIAAGRLDDLGSPEVTARQVDERRGNTPGELADELAGVTKIAEDLLAGFDDDAWVGPSPGTYDGTLGQAIEALWYDAFLHADDIRVALGRPSDVGDGGGVRVAVKHLTEILDKDGWGSATVALDGIEEFLIGGGSSEKITGDPMRFILAATGRINPADIGLDETVNVYRNS
jgi:uncharacterized protein (TIGR03083 family)